jgi:hypothetical protein
VRGAQTGSQYHWTVIANEEVGLHLYTNHPKGSLMPDEDPGPALDPADPILPGEQG